jgi:hypothetical protein
LVSGFGLTNRSTYSSANASNVTIVGYRSDRRHDGARHQVSEALSDQHVGRRPLVAVDLD